MIFVKLCTPFALLSLSSIAYAALPTGLNEAGQLQLVQSAQNNGAAFTRLENGVQVRVNGLAKNIIFYGPTLVRVNTNLGRSFAEHPSLAVVIKPASVPFEVQESSEAITLISQKLRIVTDKKSGALTFFAADGKQIARERDSAPEIHQETIADAPTYQVKQTFTIAPDESLYGLGEYNRPYMDYRGQEVLMVQTNIGIVVPLLISTKRYGILWDIYSKSIFKDTAEGASFWSESAPAGVDYYFIAGDTMDGVIAGYRDLTGAAPMIPKAAFGLFMSKERYKTQDRLVEVVKKFREDGFPIDYIVQDWQYWGGDKDGTWSGMIWNKERFPDPKRLTKTLHDDLHVKLMVSIWPSIGNDTELAHELDSKGLRFEPLHWISKQARVYDAYSAEGRSIYFKHIKKGLLDVGVDALWMDGTEVEVGGACHDPVQVEADIKNLGRNAMGDFTRYLNPYSLMTTRGTYEGQRATSNQRVFTLTRSAWAGQQRYSAAPWSGDTTASWNTLRSQIAGGLNVAMAGLPYWSEDTGGFFVKYPDGEQNPEYRELFARWHQFAIFNPIYRIHGAQIEREPYIFKTLDPPMYQSLLDAAHLRYRLLPYIYSLGWMSTSRGYSMMRGLAMDFPDDFQVRKIDDQFTFGPAFLVHPVTRAMHRIVNNPGPKVDDFADTYLPTGADWYDFWTNERFVGGQSIRKKIPLEILPLYVRAGSIVPFGPLVQYATEQPGAPYEIRIYPGADAKFTVYEDDNETYNYEKGQYATYDLSWNDAARELTIGARQGSFPGMTRTRTLNVVLATSSEGQGIAGSMQSAKTVEYSGRQVHMSFAASAQPR